jgi:molecular chaperone HscB
VEAASTRSTSDYFTFLGLSRTLNVDVADLEQRYRALSRQFHPDYFYNASPAERLASLERSSYLNDAYRTLRNPAARIDYLLKLEGVAGIGGTEANQQVPPALLEEVFALNEELDEIRAMRESGTAQADWRLRLERARKPIEAKRADHEARLQQLMLEWDRVVECGLSDAERQRILQALHERVLERNYIGNLLAGIERELNP